MDNTFFKYSNILNDKLLCIKWGIKDRKGGNTRQKTSTIESLDRLFKQIVFFFSLEENNTENKDIYGSFEVQKIYQKDSDFCKKNSDIWFYTGNFNKSNFEHDLLQL